MMPSAVHETEPNSTTNAPVKNSIEQSPLSRDMCFLPSNSTVLLCTGHSCVFSYQKSTSDFTSTRPYFSPFLPTIICHLVNDSLAPAHSVVSKPICLAVPISSRRALGLSLL